MEDNKNSEGKKDNHMKMMAACCGVPLVLIIVVSVFGINIGSLDILILLLCPILMVGMMYKMNKKEEKGCCDTQEKPVDLLPGNSHRVETDRSI